MLLFMTSMRNLFLTCMCATMQQLAQLNLVSNAISGSIPACIATLPQLVELHLVRPITYDCVFESHEFTAISKYSV